MLTPITSGVYLETTKSCSEVLEAMPSTVRRLFRVTSEQSSTFGLEGKPLTRITFLSFGRPSDLERLAINKVLKRLALRKQVVQVGEVLYLE